MLECFVRECHQINGEDDDSIMRASSRQIGGKSNQKSSDFTWGSVVTGGEAGEDQEGVMSFKLSALSAVVKFLFFFLLQAKGSSLSSKLFLTLVVTKLSDLTRTSPGPCQCVPAVERAGFACWAACEDGVGVLRRHQDEI